jgi:peptidoglycan/xylan/chitin deacetylase (PgdA/CDA1 family)
MSGLTRWLATLGVVFAFCGVASVSAAEDCPGNPDAIGTSRTIAVDPAEHPRIGAMNYPETLPLADKEVVLTFDDGPISPYTDEILDILASQCVHATFFIVGEMARARPQLVQRAYREGHTIGTHSMTHPLGFQRLPFERAEAQIEDGIEATTAALGDSKDLSPFFRFPGFGRTEATEDYAASRGLMVWSADFPADDWMRISDNEVVRRALTRIEREGKGILLLHDIHPRTVLALPAILRELKQGGYHIVHVVPASASQPKTETTPEAWLLPSRRTLAMPLVTLGDVEDLDVNFLAQHSLAQQSGADLCVLKAITTKSPSRTRVSRLAARHLSTRHATHVRSEYWGRWFGSAWNERAGGHGESHMGNRLGAVTNTPSRFASFFNTNRHRREPLR